MTKQEFLDALRARLCGLPEPELEEQMGFYSEMIEDRMEDGFSEAEAVDGMGSVDEVVSRILSEIPLAKLAKERMRPKRKMRTWEIVLLAVGSPIWLSLLIAALAVFLAGYAVIWAGVAVLWVLFAAVIGCVLGGIVGGIVLICLGKLLAGLAMLGAACFCAGLAIFAFFGCKEATKGVAWLTKMMAIGIKRCFVGKKEG